MVYWDVILVFHPKCEYNLPFYVKVSQRNTEGMNCGDVFGVFRQPSVDEQRKGKRD